MKAPSLKAGWPNRLVVAIGTFRPLCLRALLNSFLMSAASLSLASMGIRSLSWKFTPYAPASPSRSQSWPTLRRSRTGEPNGSAPTLPTVHRPKVNFFFGSGA